jgi:DNA-binding response OmpR family regulator
MSQKKVLIIDDDPGMQDAFRLIFDRAGYESIVLSSASSVLNGTAPVPDVYILDKQLSGVDGLDVCRFLKARTETQQVPVIMVSATPHVGRLAQAVCADGFIEKPFRQRDLLNMVAGFLATPAL